MSHFAVLVLSHEIKNDVESQLHEILAPYDENMEVDEYDRECYCHGRIARIAAREMATKQLGAGFIDVQRKAYWAMSEEDKEAADFEDMIKPYTDIEEAVVKNHILKDKPDPSCEDCEGSGWRESTYNPKSKWDWWQIGGRWTGYLGDYDPSEDPKNMETCTLCEGTGQRYDNIVQGKCNGCDGEGKRVSWPTQWKHHKSDIFKVSDVEWSDDKTPFAIVTPDGKWHERGEMGWFGCASNENKDWPEVAKEILYKYKDCMGVVVDCHI